MLSGIRTWPPSASAAKARSPSASVGTARESEKPDKPGPSPHPSQAMRPRINDRGDVAFLGFFAFDPTTVFNPTGLFLHHRHTLTRIAGPGDLMPGGGHVTFISALDWNVGLNNRGELAFSTGLDTGEEGLYTYSHGALHLVARTGTVIPGVGTIFSLEMGNPVVPGSPPAAASWPTSGSRLNDRGQAVFGCTLADGRGALLLATPTDDEEEGEQ